MSLLTTKFKYERQKLNNVPEVLASRKKFASKRRSAAPNDDEGTDTAKRCRHVDVSWTGLLCEVLCCCFDTALHIQDTQFSLQVLNICQKLIDSQFNRSHNIQIDSNY